MSVFLAALVAICSAAIVVAGLLAFLRNPAKPENRWFCALTAVLGAWAVLNFVDSNLQLSEGWAQLIVKLDFSTAVFIGWILMQFVALTTRDIQRRKSSGFADVVVDRTFRAGSLVVNACLVALIAFDQLFTITVSQNSPLVHMHIPFVFYSVVVVSYMVAAFYVLIASYFRAGRSRRRKLSLIALGFVIAGITNIATNLIFPNLFDDRSVVEALNFIGYAGIFLLAICMYVAITTRQLFDIRLVIARSLGYALLIGMVAVFYAGALSLASYFLVDDKALTLRSTLVSLTVTLFVASTFQYLRKFFDRVTNKLFFQDAYDAQSVVSQLNAITTATLDLEQLLSRSASLLERTLKAGYFVCVLTDEKSRISHVLGDAKPTINYTELTTVLRPLLQTRTPIVTESFEGKAGVATMLRSISAEIVYPLYANDMLIGYIVLGVKKNGLIYVQKDLRLLSIAAASLSIAAQNALRFEEIENFNATLQQKIEDATRKLRRTNEKLRKLDETKDDFISMASHQLRTPLTSVKGYVSMVLEGDAGKISPLQRKLLNQAFISSQRMVYLISDLLNVSRLRTGKFVIEPVATNLANLIKGEVDQLVETAKGRNLELVYHRPEHFPVYMLDETKLRQVVMNFIDNAIYYTPSGGTITVTLADQPHAIEFTVTDTGIGVPKAEQHHLFTKFYRAHNAKRARPDGTGLGLFMAKKVVIAQGGSTIFRSYLGKGSTFGFSFAKTHLATPPPSNKKA